MEARDRLQDLFLKIARNPTCLDDVRDERAYLFRLAHNLAIDAIRRRSTQHEKLAILALEPLAQENSFRLLATPDQLKPGRL